MGENDDFWDDLLGHIRQQVLVPVVGPDLTVVKVGDAEQTFTTLIGQRLAEKYHLTVSPGMTTMGEAVAEFMREYGRDEGERLYRVIYDIIRQYPEPGAPLCDLAAIDDLRFFVSTTPDPLLAQAVNQVRFQGRPLTRELSFSTSQSTSKQLGNEQPGAETDTVVLNLFGKAASTPEYAIHEEDRLEWLHAFRDSAGLPEWLDYRLRHHPMLFVGCEIPDWLGRFLLRSSSSTRLSLERKPFFFVGSPTSYEPSLSNFFATYCRKSLVQPLAMEPAAFVAELRERWEEQRPADEKNDGIPPPPRDAAIFISYMREDVDAARRLYKAISDLGGEAWLDERRILPGDGWRQETLAAIRHSKLFVPIISANTEREYEGYVFKEWNEAVDRARSILGRHFIVPVIVDEDYQGDPSRYRKFPDDFTHFHFGHAPAGNPDEDLLRMLTEEIRAMRRAPAA
jgi:TIR domain